MKSVSFTMAQEEDNEYLKRLMRANPMPGAISVAFEREPSFFSAVRTEGKYNQIIVARDNSRGEVVAMGSRSVKPVYINSKVTPLGYLSSLRIIPGYRNATVLGRGYQYLKELHQDNRVKAYLSTIIEDNSQALNMLTSGRCNLPHYHDMGYYHTHIIQFKDKRNGRFDGLRVVRGSEVSVDKIIDCLQRNGKEKQFFPYYEKNDFLLGTDYLRDFTVNDFYVAVRGGRIIGVLAKWDQGVFKQAVIAGYGRGIRRMRPIYNFFARILRKPKLPCVGAALKFFFVDFIAIEGNDPVAFSALMHSLYNDHIGSVYSYMVVGLHDNDPLRDVLDTYQQIKYKSRVFLVHWQDGKEIVDSLDKRIPYLAIGSL